MSTDIIESSIHAYINAVNKMIYDRESGRAAAADRQSGSIGKSGNIGKSRVIERISKAVLRKIRSKNMKQKYEAKKEERPWE
jgi:hypothetical protein